MVDYVLHADSEREMLSGYGELRFIDDDGVVSEAGKFPDGTSWALMDWGEVDGETGYFSVLRCVGPAPAPSMPDGITVMWRSDDPEEGRYPDALPRFA